MAKVDILMCICNGPLTVHISGVQCYILTECNYHICVTSSIDHVFVVRAFQIFSPSFLEIDNTSLLSPITTVTLTTDLDPPISVMWFQ